MRSGGNRLVLCCNCSFRVCGRKWRICSFFLSDIAGEIMRCGRNRLVLCSDLECMLDIIFCLDVYFK